MSDTVYIEVCQKSSSTLSKDDTKELIKSALEECTSAPFDINLMKTTSWDIPWTEGILQKLKSHIDSIKITTLKEEITCTSLKEYRVQKFLIYSLSQEEAATETMHHESEELNVASHVILPSVHYEGLWESLYYDTDLKHDLLNFIETTIIFSEKKVDPNIISWNKVVLLYGPPGTGKTSLCKALAQKIAIRFGEKYSYVELIEINSHSLFSKWFSESGKLVMKLFDEVRRLLENSNSFVCVLIDEVESLAHARKSCTNGTEPSDAIRVVNALLTQLDQIKSYPNVMILTTSNVTEAIDLAFVDRADIKQFIGHPESRAIYHIYRSCITELIRTDLVKERCLLEQDLNEKFISTESYLFLKKLSQTSVGLSGRALRKIPFLAYAMCNHSSPCYLYDFLLVMEKTIEKNKLKEKTYLVESKLESCTM